MANKRYRLMTHNLAHDQWITKGDYQTKREAIAHLTQLLISQDMPTDGVTIRTNTAHLGNFVHAEIFGPKSPYWIW